VVELEGRALTQETYKKESDGNKANSENPFHDEHGRELASSATWYDGSTAILYAST
jgi:hypothetical protein